VASENRPEGATPRDDVPRSLKLFALGLAAFHCFAVAVWLAPSSWTRDRLLNATRGYTRTAKADQNWAMFAPDPLAYDRRMWVKATLVSGEEREMDITTPINKAMRSFSFARVGKMLKSHDRILSGGERQYEKGFALYQCQLLARQWGELPKSVALYREYETVELDTKAFRVRNTAPQKVFLSTHDCPP
jgi:hypothetical protein